MDPSLGYESLVEILLLDNPWSPSVGIDSAQVGDAEAWQHVLSELAAVKAQRLLDLAWTGRVLDQPTAVRKMVEVGMPIGAFQVPGLVIRVTEPVAVAMANVQLTVSQIDLTQTHAMAWERVQGILEASRLFNMQPKTFLTQHPLAQDWILRLSSSPEQFRAHQRERIDAKHPDILQPRVQALYNILRAETKKQVGPLARVQIFIGFPGGDGYWALRAQWLQEVEAQIARIWPGYAYGLPSTQREDD